MIGRCTDVVGHVVEEVLSPALSEIGETDILRRERQAVAAVVEPFGIEAGAFAETVAHRHVGLVAVVELVVEPVGVVIIKLSLVPRQRIGRIHLQPAGGIVSVKLQPVEAATALDDLRVPVVGWRLQAEPVGVLQQVGRPFVIAFQRQQPVPVGLHIGACGQLVTVHGVKAAGGRHPIVARQVNVGIGNLMHKLRHRGVAGLERETGTDLILDGCAGVDVGKRLALDVEESSVETAVDAPMAVDGHLVLGIDVPLCSRKVTGRTVLQGVALFAISVDIDLVVALRPVIMQREVVAEAQVMVRRGPVVEGRTITHVVDGGVVAVLGVVACHVPSVSSGGVVFLRPQL